jgi:hypothetical protein
MVGTSSMTPQDVEDTAGSESVLSERDRMLMRLGRFGPPEYAHRLLSLFMKLDEEERALCLFSDRHIQMEISKAIDIFRSQDDTAKVCSLEFGAQHIVSTPVTPSPSPRKNM